MISDCSSISSFNHISAYPVSASTQMAHTQNETINTKTLPQRTSSSVSGRSSVDQRAGLAVPNALHVVPTHPITNTFTARNSAPPQQHQQQQSAFRRPLPDQENNAFNQLRSAPQKSTANGLYNGYQQQSSNVIIPRPSKLTVSDSCSCM